MNIGNLNNLVLNWQVCLLKTINSIKRNLKI